MSSTNARSRAAALARYRAARNEGRNALDEIEEKDDDVYDIVDEDEYQRIVESRRLREDFVIDDNGIGYYDDGEERFGEEEGDDQGESRKRRQMSATAVLTQQTLRALKKARKATATSSQADTGGDGLKNRSMWDYLNKGSSVVNNPSHNKLTAQSRPAVPDVDDLLKQLDDPLVLTTSSTTKLNATSIRGPHRRYNPGNRFASRPGSRPMPHHRATRYERDGEEDLCHDDDAQGWIPDADEPEPSHKAPSTPTKEEERIKSSPPSTGTAKSVTFAEKDQYHSIPESTQSPTRDFPTKGEDDGHAPTTEDPQPQPTLKRRRFARPSFVSEPAQEQEPDESPTATSVETVTTAPTTVKIDVTSASFQPEHIASEVCLLDFKQESNSLEQLIQRPEGKDPYLEMFWTDLSERNGDILLFGKVPVADDKFVSACVLVQGNLRNLFVLPRRDEKDGSYDMLCVHKEVNQMLHSKDILPRQAGVSWAGKVVKRNYAFDDPNIPREETEYFKVVYNAKYPVPDADTCNNGGEHFVRILGANASVTENFIVKRKLMGPCWIRVAHPMPLKAPVSWCKVECCVESPKHIVREMEYRSPPPAVTLTLKLRTVVNPATHKLEIVSVSAVCHKRVMLETASDETSKHMTQLSLIRPLDQGFPRDINQMISRSMPQLCRETNERAMLNRLFAQIGQWDPDVIVGHNSWGYDMEVLLTRCMELKISTWSKIGRRRRRDLPGKSFLSSRKDYAIAEALSGRLLCDTYLSAKELLRETTYSLTNLAATQLKVNRQDIEPADVPNWFASSKTIVQLALATLSDAQLIQRLMFKLQVLPLTKQLTCIAGNLWSHTLKSNRAERTEYLLLHEFHRLKYLPPEKKRPKKSELASNKAKYSGGLVLEPKKGLYDSFILLLDFNSLYPSIIQEYNLCFTTIDWSRCHSSDESLPPLPESDTETGVLPRVIKNLVERRREVKKYLKGETNPEKRDELDIRQKALKLTANSMYGCLGFSNSRFFAQPIAALVTAKGRDTLQRTVDIAQNEIGVEVIYGDTDSIMINTRLAAETDLPQVWQLGERIKKDVNRHYRTLELEIDGVFRSMLLLKKKKYAAKTIELLPDGKVKYGEELKGLDLVRRDWCVQSRDTGRFVTSQILSGQDSEVIVQNIYNHLEDIAIKMRSGQLPIEKFVITKGLSKHPNDYPDAKSLPHVHVAKHMLKNNVSVNTGDHIPYVITEQLQGSDLSAVERARHPEEISRSEGILKPDVEWYLVQQILPPVSRLCEPIEGMTRQSLAEKLGLDVKHYEVMRGTQGDDEEKINFVPSCQMPDSERFNGVEKLRFYCLACGHDDEMPGAVRSSINPETGTYSLSSGFNCPNPNCIRPENWGHDSLFACTAQLMNTMSFWVRSLATKYYQGTLLCDEPSCRLSTRQISGFKTPCLRRGCQGKMHDAFSERDVYNHIKYLEGLFDYKHAFDELKNKGQGYGADEQMMYVTASHQLACEELRQYASSRLRMCAYGWISPNVWQSLGAVRSLTMVQRQ